MFDLLVRDDEYLVNMQHTVIPSWYQREGYIKAMANLIEKELQKFERPDKVIHCNLLLVWSFYNSAIDFTWLDLDLIYKTPELQLVL